MLIVITVDYVRKEIKFVILDLTKVFSDVFYKSLFRHNFWILFVITSRIPLQRLCHGSPVHFVLFCQLLALDRYGTESRQRNRMLMAKSEIRDKQICPLSIIFEATNSRAKL